MFLLGLSPRSSVLRYRQGGVYRGEGVILSLYFVFKAPTFVIERRKFYEWGTRYLLNKLPSGRNGCLGLGWFDTPRLWRRVVSCVGC